MFKAAVINGKHFPWQDNCGWFSLSIAFSSTAQFANLGDKILENQRIENRLLAFGILGAAWRVSIYLNYRGPVQVIHIGVVS